MSAFFENEQVVFVWQKLLTQILKTFSTADMYSFPFLKYLKFSKAKTTSFILVFAFQTNFSFVVITQFTNINEIVNNS